MSSYSRLPDEIKDMIGMFNIVHRPQMKIILNELMVLHFPENTDQYWIHRHRMAMNQVSSEMILIMFCYVCDTPIPFNGMTICCSDRCEHTMTYDREDHEPISYLYDQDGLAYED